MMYIRLISTFLLFTFFFSEIKSVENTFVPILTVEENDRLESLADETGANEWRFMTHAGKSVAFEAERMVNFKPNAKIIVLVGKGYNGGNALWAGYLLKLKGYQVTAYLLFPIEESPSICQQIMDMFKKVDGEIVQFESFLNSDESADERIDKNSEGNLVIDGILGASFKGNPRGIVAKAIQWANLSKYPILSVDIPSGLDGNTGMSSGCIQATHTVAFFFPRIGFFINEGPNCVGNFSVFNLGISSHMLSQLTPIARLRGISDSKRYFEMPEILKLSRQDFANFSNLMDSHHKDVHDTNLHSQSLELYQEYAEKNQVSLLIKDHPMMLFQPLEKPIIFKDSRLYKVTEGGEISSIRDFFEE